MRSGNKLKQPTREFIINREFARYSGGELDRYFNEVKTIAMITAEEEAALARMIRHGDNAALEKLVRSNLRFVITVAKQFQHQGVDIGDLINEGNVGLIVAAKKFDETKGFKFISYAIWWIRQAIIVAVAEQSRLIHIPYSYITLKSKFDKAYQRLEQAAGRSPTNDEIAIELQVSEEKVNDLITLAPRHFSIDRPLSGNSETCLLDLIPSQEQGADSQLFNASLKKLLQLALFSLNPRNRQVLTLYFGIELPFPVPMEDIARNFGISVEHTRRLKDQALLHLRSSTFAPLLQSHLS